MNDDRYYRPSGAVPFAGTILMLLCGSAAAAALAFGYALLTAFNPYVYLTAIGTVLFGLGVGGAVVGGAILGKVRNQVFIMIVALCAGLAGLYLTWAFYIPYILGRLGLPGLPFVFDPTFVFETIKLLGQNGVWEMFGWSPSGWQLFAVWILEAAIIAGGAVIIAAAARKPYCEACSRWTEEEKLPRPLALTDPERLRGALEEERYEVLDELRDQEVVPENSLRATLYTCPQCADSDYLTVSHVRITTSKDGNVHTQSTELVKRLYVPHALVEHLRVSLADAGPLLATAEVTASEGDQEPVEFADDGDAADQDAAPAEPRR